MKVLFALESAEGFYLYRSVIEVLCSNGHEVLMFFSKGVNHIMRPVNAMRLVEEFKDRFKNFDYSQSVYRPDVWRKILVPGRAIANYRRFVILKDRPPFYRNRYKKFLPFWLKPLVLSDQININFLIKAQFIGRALSLLEAILPLQKSIVNHIKNYAPDVVVVSSGNVLSSSSDFEYLRAAQALGIPNALLVASWDYLETKGLLHVIPDRLLVWNDSHREEAVSSHGVPKEKIRLVGAPLFDEFFSELRPSGVRAEFCSRLGLRPEDPIVLYIGSSGIFGDETEFLKSLRRALDMSLNASLRRTQIMVRPHPANRRNFKKMVMNMRDVIVAPTVGEMPSTPESLQFFYDSLHHAAAVTGIGSSGFINALIVNKPAVTILTDYYRHLQAEAPHFKHLLKSGALKVINNFDELPIFLEKVLAGRDETQKHRHEFIQSYVRPRGLNCSAGEVIMGELQILVAKRRKA